MSTIVGAAAYHKGCRVAEIGLDEGRAWAARPDHFVWIGIHKPTPEDLRALQRQFDLHELAIEDALVAHQRPKIDVYGNGVFVALRTVRREGGRSRFGETHVFAGRGYVVSVRHGESTSYAHVRTRLESSPHLLRHGEDYVLHAILDFIVDEFYPVIETIEAEVVTIEQRVLKHSLSRHEIERIHELRRELRRLRNAVVPTADICHRLEHLHLDFIHPPIKPYFRDVADHVRLVAEQIDGLRESLNHAFEAGLLLESGRQNQTMRTFAAWAAILAVPTAIAGVYGMNFDYMPELHWRYGYPLVLAAIIAACGGLWFNFKRSGWL